jgi:hypothetical protein
MIMRVVVERGCDRRMKEEGMMENSHSSLVTRPVGFARACIYTISLPLDFCDLTTHLAVYNTSKLLYTPYHKIVYQIRHVHQPL